MKTVNAIVSKSDVHFYPELSASQIELTLSHNKGKAVLRIPMDSDSMYGILNIFNKDSVYDLNGQYCRLCFDNSTGRVNHIKNILHDECGSIVNNPIV